MGTPLPTAALILKEGLRWLIDGSREVVDFAEGLTEVSKITLGFIETAGGRKSGGRVVKIIDEESCIQLRFTQKRSVQTVRVYTSNSQATKLAIARFARNNGYELRFGNLTPT